ncbi:hypothetical protein BKA65DRAFT_542940 [Rhexocercosporidium sp. MPI-PUGE-AT-0058]|nr:hypothetical protein BKA65DRAFT_542940 [Rhexocercosporidium sp. MPI-PUGE-AT-0058]
MAMGDKRSLIICLNGAFIALSTTAITARLLTRAFLIKLVGADDILIVVAFILSLIYSSLIILCGSYSFGNVNEPVIDTKLATKYGEGLHIQHLKLENVPAYTMAMFFYYICQMFIKLSYLAFYLRLSPSKKFRAIVYIFMVLVSAYAIGSSVASCLMCVPLSKLWHPDAPGTCFDIAAYQLSATAINMVFDIVVFVLPIPVFWSLKLPRRQRIGLIGVTTLVDAVVWSAVEVHVALLISCTAAFKALIQAYLPGFLGSYGATKPSRNRHTYHQSLGDAYELQSGTGCGPKVKTTVSANPDGAKVNESQDYIMKLGEEIRCETDISIHSSSMKGVDGAIGGHIV